MLDSLTWAEWKEQLAYDAICCDPLERLADILKLGFCALCQVQGADVSPIDFEPDAARRQLGGEDDYVTPDQQVALLGSQIGANS